MNSRAIYNNTPSMLKVTLYIQVASNHLEHYGTRVINLQPQETVNVEFGDLRNNRLCALCISDGRNGIAGGFCYHVNKTGDSVDFWLNGELEIEISELTIAQIQKARLPGFREELLETS